LDRTRIRQQFERRFSVERMTQDYLTIYEGILRGGLRNADADGETEDAA
jgi:hypothetical protein